MLEYKQFLNNNNHQLIQQIHKYTDTKSRSLRWFLKFPMKPLFLQEIGMGKNMQSSFGSQH